jgi:hypothetical protein
VKKPPRLVLAAGWPQASGALVMVVAAGGVIAASSWSRSQTAGRLAILGVALFVIALVLGSGLLIGLTTLPFFVAELVSSIGGDNPAWIRAVVVGVLWYLAAELGWDAIERRDGVRRTAAYNHRRLNEANTVVLLSLVVTAAVFLVSSVAPVRTLIVIAVALLGFAAVLAGAAQRLRRTDASKNQVET